jgi:K+-sensing histidine kinase KdpD
MGDQIENIALKSDECKDIISLASNMVNCPTVLSGMSHEVRTHMNAIVAFSFLMNRSSCNEAERAEFTSQILASCEQLIGLLDNFIDSAIIDTGNSKADLKICRLNSLLDELFAEFRDILRKDDHNDITLITENSFSEDTEVLIDSNRLFRVIRNLFQNALNNTNTGYIKVGYNLINNELTFYVLDSGQGYFKCKEFLNTEDLNDSLSKYNDTGSAINLTLAKKIIHMLGGSVRIECNGLTGSGIYFLLPVKVIHCPDISINKYVNNMIAI